MGWLAFCLAALLLVVLAAPIRVSFSLSRVNRVEGQVRIRWLFGLVRWIIPLPGAAKKSSPVRKRARKASKPRKARSRRGVPAMLKQASFRRRTFRLVRDILRALHPRDLYVRLRIGLGDPADTGRLWAVLGPIAGIAADVRNADLRLEPEFMDPVLEVESHGEIRLIPLRLMYLASAFLLSPATLQAFRTSRRRSR